MSSGRESRVQRILDLCDAWVAASTPADGGVQLGNESERHRLRNNDIWPHDLNYQELRAACLGLTRVLLRPGLNTVIDWDHKWFWAWCGELFAGRAANYFVPNESEIQNLFGLACRAALAGIWNPGASGGFEQHRQRSEDMEPNARELVQYAHTVIVYLAFPLLEAISKKACSGFVQQNGMVVQTFSVPSRRYSPGQRCSSLRDILVLLHNRVATHDLSAGLDDVRAHLQVLSPSDDPFDLLYQWRNSSLHGSASLPTIGGTVLNVAALIALDGIAETYEALQHEALAGVQFELQTRQSVGIPVGSRSYYPPFV